MGAKTAANLHTLQQFTQGSCVYFALHSHPFCSLISFGKRHSAGTGYDDDDDDDDDDGGGGGGDDNNNNNKIPT